MKRLHYGWVVAGVTWFTLLAAAGFRSTPGVLIVPLQHEFGWSRATTAPSSGTDSSVRAYWARARGRRSPVADETVA